MTLPEIQKMIKKIIDTLDLGMKERHSSNTRLAMHALKAWIHWYSQ